MEASKLRDNFKSQVDEYFSKLTQESFELTDCLFSRHLGCKKQIELFTKGTMHVYRCECGLVYNRNQPTQGALEDFYELSKAMSTWSKLKDDPIEAVRQTQKYDRAASFLEKSQAKKVLDLGCGNGFWLSVLKSRIYGLVTHGTELNEEAAKKAIAAGHWIIEKSAESFLEWNQISYDAVSLWGVAEHIKDPLETLHKIKSIVKINGHVVICVPNVFSRCVRRLWDKCYTFCPQHLWYFDSISLKRLVKMAGFEPVETYTIEPEAEVTVRHEWGLPPYGKIPAWAEYRYVNRDWVEATAKDILKQNEGYKIVCIAQKVKI